VGRLTSTGATLAMLGTAHAALNARLLRRPVLGATTRSRVSVLVPARDEAAAIVDCLTALRAQDVREILVLDDGSADATAELARSVDDPRVRVLTGAALPAGAVGKAHACAQLAAAADAGSEVLVFLDADVRVVPGAVDTAAALLDSLDADLLSAHPREIAGTVAERLVQPLLQWSILTFLPLRLAERSPRPSLSAANGQFLVVRRCAYERAGGHATVMHEVLEDLALARAVKRTGGRVVLADGSALASCRMYDGWSDLRDGYGKSLWSAFGSRPGAAAVLALLGLAYVVPAVAALRGSRAGLAGVAAGIVGRVITARATGGDAWPDALAQPVSVSLFGWLMVRSHVQHRRGRLSWRGRPLG